MAKLLTVTKVVQQFPESLVKTYEIMLKKPFPKNVFLSHTQSMDVHFNEEFRWERLTQITQFVI